MSLPHLEPCPWCGAENAVFGADGDWKHFVVCPECMAESPHMSCDYVAAIDWNFMSRLVTWDEAVDVINAYRRTCTVKHRREKGDCFLTVLSCGHEFVEFDERIPKYCPSCGARVVG